MLLGVVDPVMFNMSVASTYKVRNFGNHSVDFIAKPCIFSAYKSSPYEK